MNRPMIWMSRRCARWKRVWKNSPVALLSSRMIAGFLTASRRIFWPLKVTAMSSGLKAITRIMKKTANADWGQMPKCRNASNISSSPDSEKPRHREETPGFIGLRNLQSELSRQGDFGVHRVANTYLVSAVRVRIICFIGQIFDAHPHNHIG